MLVRKTSNWIDIISPTLNDLKELGTILNLSALEIQDVFKGRQRTKIEIHKTHLFINAYDVFFHDKTGRILVQELGIFVTSDYLVTIRPNEDIDFKKHWNKSKKLSVNGTAFLLWGVLDLLIENYYKVLETLDLELEKLEEQIFDGKVKPESEIQKQTYNLRKTLVSIKHNAVPMREIINSLLKHDNANINDEMYPYFQDLYDHTIRLADWTESVRDLIGTLVDTNLNIQGHRMNVIMKKVTSWAAIISVPTAITGFYGQNVPYPGFGLEWGFWMSTGVTVIISSVLYFLFKKRNWL